MIGNDLEKIQLVSSLIEEVKDEYIKSIKKLHLGSIFKPFPSPHLVFPDKSQEIPIKKS